MQDITKYPIETMRVYSLLLMLFVLTCTELTAKPKEPLTTKNDPIKTVSDDYLDSLLTSYPYKLDEIVVMGFKQDKSYQLSPQSATSLSANFLQQENIHNIKDITAVVSNLYMPDYGSKLTSPIYIRGIGNKTGTPAVGLYIDGIPYFQQSTFDFNLHEIAQIDVLKGPQGTLYGRNTMGGVIDVHTTSPLDKQGTNIRFSGGNYNNYIVSANHSLRLKENMGLAISGSYDHNGGYDYNSFLNKKADESNAATGRVRYDWQINPKLLMRIISSIDYTNQGGYPYSKLDKESGKFAPVSYDGDSSYRRLISSSGANFKYTGNGFKMNSQTSFQYYNDHQRIDQDFTEKSLNFTKQDQKQYMVSEEFTIKSDTQSKYQWLFGAFGFYQQIKNEVNVDFIPAKYVSNKNYDMPTYGVALYHQSTLNDIFIKGLSLSAGIRFDYEHARNTYSSFKVTESDITPTGDFDNKLNFKQITPKFSIQYLSPTEQNFYATVSKGYKTGGFNTSFDNSKDKSYDPEYSWNYEVGAKVNFFQNRLKADVALFYIDWEDKQVTQPMPSGVGRVIRNAGRSISKGIEAGISAQFVKDFIVRASYGYTKAYYKKYNFTEKDGTITDFKNKRIPNLPNQTVSADASYSFRNIPGLDKLEIGLTYLGTGKIYWNDSNTFAKGYYSLLNGRIAAHRNNITLSVWSKNMTNTKYTAYCFGMGKDDLYGQEGRPFTIGGTFNYSF